jgi:hypothetical protein
LEVPPEAISEIKTFYIWEMEVYFADNPGDDPCKDL